jgi:hypothetical protein
MDVIIKKNKMNKTNNSNIVNSTDLEKGIALTREEIKRMQQDLVSLREAAKSSEVDVFNVFTEYVSSFDEAFPNFYDTYQKDTGGLIKINKTIESLDTHPELVDNLTVDPITRPILTKFLGVISDFKREDLDTEQTKELCNRLNSIYYSFISRRDSVKIEEGGFIINGTKVTIDIAKLPQYLTEFRKYTDMTIGSVNINPIHLISGAFAYNTILKSYAGASSGPDTNSKAYPVSVTPLMRARMVRLFAVFGAPMIMTSILVIAYLKPLATIHVINEVNVKTDSNMGTTNKTTKLENKFFLFTFIINYFKEFYNKLLFGVLLFMFILRFGFPYYYNMVVSIPLPTFISFFIL